MKITMTKNEFDVTVDVLNGISKSSGLDMDLENIKSFLKEQTDMGSFKYGPSLKAGEAIGIFVEYNEDFVVDVMSKFGQYIPIVLIQIKAAFETAKLMYDELNGVEMKYYKEPKKSK